jgi:hypothetical protein
MPVEYRGDTLADLADKLESVNMETGRRAAGDGLERFRHNIEINTPVETSRLRRSYKITPIHYGPVEGLAYAAYAWQGACFTEVEYAPYVEYGTGLWGPRHAKYEIKPKHPGGVLAFQPNLRHNGSVVLDIAHNVQKGGTVFVRVVLHPGSPGASMFRIGAVITEHEADEWSYQALRYWESAMERPDLVPVIDTGVVHAGS